MDQLQQTMKRHCIQMIKFIWPGFYLEFLLQNGRKRTLNLLQASPCSDLGANSIFNYNIEIPITEILRTILIFKKVETGEQVKTVPEFYLNDGIRLFKQFLVIL